MSDKLTAAIAKFAAAEIKRRKYNEFERDKKITVGNIPYTVLVEIKNEEVVRTDIHRLPYEEFGDDNPVKIDLAKLNEAIQKEL